MMEDRDGIDVEKSIEAWTPEQRESLYIGTKIFQFIVLLTAAALIVAPYVYRLYIPSWLMISLVAFGGLGLLTTIVTLAYNPESEFFSALAYSLSGLMLCGHMAFLIYIWLQIEIDLNYFSASQSLSKKDFFFAYQILLIIIIAALGVGLISYFFIVYNVCVNLDQYTLVLIQHFYNYLYISSSFIYHYYSRFRCLELLVLSAFLCFFNFGVNLKMRKVYYFTAAVLLLLYTVFNEIQHHQDFRRAQAFHQHVLDTCVEQMKLQSSEWLQSECGCTKAKGNLECSKAEQYIEGPAIHCLNMNCCGILSDRLSFKHHETNISCLLHQLISFSLVGIMMYISQKPPIQKEGLRLSDFGFGLLIVLTIVIGVLEFKYKS